MADATTLRKKLAYQLTYRGTKELDKVMQMVKVKLLPSLDDDLLTALDRFLQIPETELTATIFGQKALPDDLPQKLHDELIGIFKGTP